MSRAWVPALVQRSSRCEPMGLGTAKVFSTEIYGVVGFRVWGLGFNRNLWGLRVEDLGVRVQQKFMGA